MLSATIFYMDTIIIPVTDFIRKFGDYANRLPSLEKIILTREGRPFAELKLSPEERNRKLLSLRGSWDGKLFDNDKIWKAVLIRRNRKRTVKI